MDPLGVIGLALGVSAIVLGQFLEGGDLGSMLQPAAAVIVIGGTAGATLLSVTRADARQGLRMLGSIFRSPPARGAKLIETFVQLAEVARKDGFVALEERIRKHPDSFLRTAMQHVIDGTATQLLQDMLRTELEVRYEQSEAGIKLYQTAGGYSPTLGILGAVLGLIHVMENLDDPSQLGAGIAVAFVATLYGVGLANMVLLPIASKLRRLLENDRLCDEMVLEGALAIESGHSPRAVRDRLGAFLKAP